MQVITFFNYAPIIFYFFKGVKLFMENEKINEIAIKNGYQNAQMALVSLDDVLDVAKGGLKQELLAERDGYEKLLTEFELLAKKLNVKINDVNAMKKSMLAASIKMKTAIDDSDSHVAEMTLKGTVTGVTELIRDISDNGHLYEPEVLALIKKLKDFEEKCEQNLKKYI